ncbi:MAG: hypothetical protein ACI9ON_003793, partial [Limisphaerales bacterium]
PKFHLTNRFFQSHSSSDAGGYGHSAHCLVDLSDKLSVPCRIREHGQRLFENIFVGIGHSSVSTPPLDACPEFRTVIERINRRKIALKWRVPAGSAAHFGKKGDMPH